MRSPGVSARSARTSTKPKPKPIDVAKGLALLKQNYPHAHCALHFRNPFELLVATILSAQCTDERVNLVTPQLWLEFPDSWSLAEAPVHRVEELIRSTGFFRNKAKNLVLCAQSLVRDHKGLVPQSLEALVLLPGVGRKTAHVVLGNAYGIASGVVVDTHVGRLARRFGWTQNESAEKVEQDLNAQVPATEWIQVSHWMIWHGRSICQARSPKCDRCFFQDQCPSAKMIE